MHLQFCVLKLNHTASQLWSLILDGLKLVSHNLISKVASTLLSIALPASEILCVSRGLLELWYS